MYSAEWHDLQTETKPADIFYDLTGDIFPVGDHWRDSGTNYNLTLYMKNLDLLLTEAARVLEQPCHGQYSIWEARSIVCSYFSKFYDIIDKYFDDYDEKVIEASKNNWLDGAAEEVIAKAYKNEIDY